MSARTPTPQQAQVIETWGSGMAVNAGAGTGKSTTLVEKCKVLFQKEGTRFAAVSFTEKSASELKTRLLEEGIRLGSNHWVSTLHGLCGSIVREFPREAGFDGEERLLSEVESRLIWNRALEPLWFDGVEGENRKALERLLEREKRDDLEALLGRVKSLSGLGLLLKMQESQDPDVEALRTLSEWALDRYDRMKRRLGAMDFDDLEKGAERALQCDWVAETYHKRFDLVLVDEFQDTNPIQASILEKFIQPGAKNLVVVGDPKQSIYRFRDADVSIFTDLCERLENKVSLTKNFRSDPRLLNFINGVCAPLFGASNLDYEPLEPGLPEMDEKHPVIRVPIQYPSDLARFVSHEVARGVPLGDMVILLKRIKGREEWIKGLSKAGVPLALSSGGFFYADPRVYELVSFLRWWFEPHQRHSGAIFLRAPWVGVSDRELDQWFSKPGDLKGKFLESSHPVAQALAKMKDRTLSPGQWLMELLVDDKVETEIGMHVLQLWHRCEEWSANGMSALDVVRELSRKIQNSERETEIPPPASEGQLRILTIHASKGLEFPHVILPDLKKSAQRARPMPLLYWDRKEGVYLSRRDFTGEREKKNPEEMVWKEREQLKELDESKRLFYVALTRAQKRLILVDEGWEQGKSEGETEEAELITPPKKKKEIGIYEKEHWRRWLLECGQDIPEVLPPPTVSEAIFKKRLNTVQKSKKSAASIAPVKPRFSVTELNDLARCSLKYEKLFVRPEIELLEYIAPQDEEFEESYVPQNEIGTEVHRALELGDMDLLQVLQDRVGENRFRAQAVRDWVDKSGWLEKTAIPEFAFEVPLEDGSQVIVGSMDRLVHEKTFDVLDFKVTAANKSPADLIETYQAQLKIYAWAISRLEPAAQNHTSSRLIHFSKGNVQEVEVKIPSFKELNREIESLVREAAEIVKGKPGIPKVGAVCEYCDYKPKCPAYANLV